MFNEMDYFLCFTPEIKGEHAPDSQTAGDIGSLTHVCCVRCGKAIAGKMKLILPAVFVFPLLGEFMLHVVK